jgi:hypothetical protein
MRYLPPTGKGMLQRLIALLLIIVPLGGCLTTGSPTGGGAVPVEKMRAERKSIVVVHTSLHNQQGLARCDSIQATLAQANAEGQYVMGQTITLKAPFDLKQIPSRVEVPAGEYGIVRLACGHPRGNSSYFNARVAKRGSIIDGSGAIFEKPFAQFTVAPGEVVDIGSLRLPSRGNPTPTFGGPRGFFIPIVTPIPDEWLKNLAEEDPNIYAARVVRPMIPSEDCQQEGNRVRCAVRRPKGT